MQGTSNYWTVQEVLSACEWNDHIIAVGAGEGLANQGLVEQTSIPKLQCKSEKNGIEAIENGLL